MKRLDVGQLYTKYYGGDKERRALFAALAGWCAPQRVLYPGSFIHLAASFEFPTVTYVDTNVPAKRFFAQREAVLALVEREKAYSGPSSVDFLHRTYDKPLPLADGAFDLLISLYAGFIAKPCKRYLRVGGLLVVNNSHADAGVAAIDPEYELVAVLKGRGDRLSVSEDSLDAYLIPKKSDIAVTEAYLHERGRGVAYTKPATAYVFRRLAL